MAENKSIYISDDCKKRAVEILWSWDQEHETGDLVLARVLKTLFPQTDVRFESAIEDRIDP